MTVTPLTSLPNNLGLLVQIAFNKGVFNQINDDVREWEQILAMRVNDPLARTSRYAIQTGMGPAATQMRNPGTQGRTFPRAQYNRTREIEFALKEWNTTIGLPWAIINRAMTAKDKKYLEPIAYETTSKAISNKRVMTADWYADGTGVRGVVGSTTLTQSSDGTSVDDPATFTVQLDVTDSPSTVTPGSAGRGYAGWFEYDDLFQLISEDGTTRRYPTSTTSTYGGTAQTTTAVQPTTGAFYVLRVKDRDYVNNRVQFEVMVMDTATNSLTGAFRTGGATIAAWFAAAVTAGAHGDCFYRYDQPTYPNLSIAVPDYGSISECTPGLETLSAYDGRTLDGVIRNGILGGTHLDCLGAGIDYPYFETGLSDAKRKVGEGKYKYAKGCMAAETHGALVISREADRRFNLYTDNKRGTTYWAFSHRTDIVEAYVSEFCRQDRVWALPENKTAQQAGKVFEFHGTDFMPMKGPDGQSWRLRPSSGGGYTADFEQYIQGMGRFVCKHSAPVLRLHNFLNT